MADWDRAAEAYLAELAQRPGVDTGYAEHLYRVQQVENIASAIAIITGIALVAWFWPARRWWRLAERNTIGTAAKKAQRAVTQLRNWWIKDRPVA